ncbi:MAG: hypothetical protein C0418_00240 [Coriobacteriaceae bacterium]|nr:hypothetical protein [Coriobacteriaceae bacterium]
MTAAPYIALAVLVALLLAGQVWIARSTARLAGGRSIAPYIKAFNVALLAVAIGIAVYAMVRR